MPPRIVTYRGFREVKTDQSFGFGFGFVLLSLKEEEEKEEVILEYNNQNLS